MEERTIEPGMLYSYEHPVNLVVAKFAAFALTFKNSLDLDVAKLDAFKLIFKYSLDLDVAKLDTFKLTFKLSGARNLDRSKHSAYCGRLCERRRSAGIERTNRPGHLQGD
jgi:hypothetical protein